MKCDVVKSMVMAQEEWDLADQIAAQMGIARNELLRRCVHHALLNLLISGLHPVNVNLILKEARGHLLIPNRLAPLLAGR
jgi:hypothetical protein